MIKPALLDNNLVKVPAKAIGKALGVRSIWENAHPLKDIRADVLQQDEANTLIAEKITSGDSFMAARFGATELSAMTGYWLKNLATPSQRLRALFADGDIPYPTRNQTRRMKIWSGFFPAERRYIDQFSHLMFHCMDDVDLLASWRSGEFLFKDKLATASVCSLNGLEPFYSTVPWTSALKDRVVLVIHPFTDTIEDQYTNQRANLFPNTDILPEFEMKTIKAVQSVAGQKTGFDTWFDALDHMKEKISECDFDTAIIGCGAYGFPLASFIKNQGKQAVHLGGVTQLLFGIKGARWDNTGFMRDFYNPSWTRPSESETPKNFEKVEGGCYW